MDDQQIAEYILKNGKQYKPALCPAFITRGKVGDCFDICLLNALHSELRYVEGIAKHPKKEHEWILHAWLTDGVHAYDPTWRAETADKTEIPVPTFYVGIEMDTEGVARFVQATKYKSVIANAEKNRELAEALLPQGFPAFT